MCQTPVGLVSLRFLRLRGVVASESLGVGDRCVQDQTQHSAHDFVDHELKKNWERFLLPTDRDRACN